MTQILTQGREKAISVDQKLVVQTSMMILIQIQTKRIIKIQKNCKATKTYKARTPKAKKIKHQPTLI
jgi:hypothetical protein